jgi:uncharacterized protein (TIGR03435 family)
MNELGLATKQTLRRVAVIGIALFLKLILAGWCALGVAQAPAAAPVFDVASVRIAPDCTGFAMSPSGARLFNLTHASLTFLIGMAYKAPVGQMENRPGWMDTTCFDVTARAEGEGNLGNDQLRLMLQNLLAQRFHLAVHHETKEFDGYALVVAKNGPILPATKGGPAGGQIDSEGLIAHNVTMVSLATLLTHPLGAHVIDKTGIKGSYDFRLSFAPDTAGADSTLPSIFTALEEQLGLKLVAQKVPVEMLVIDHLDKTPTEN